MDRKKLDEVLQLRMAEVRKKRMRKVPNRPDDDKLAGFRGRNSPRDIEDQAAEASLRELSGDP